MSHTLRYILLVITTLLFCSALGSLYYFKFDTHLGTVASTLLALGMYSGVIGYLGFSDVLIWYKRWMLRKYETQQEYKIGYRCYTPNFVPKNVELKKVMLKRCIISMDGTVYYKFERDNEKSPSLYLRLNPITNGATIVDEFGNDVNAKSLKYSLSHNEYFNREVHNFLKLGTGYSIAIDSFSIKRM